MPTARATGITGTVGAGGINRDRTGSGVKIARRGLDKSARGATRHLDARSRQQRQYLRERPQYAVGARVIDWRRAAGSVGGN